MTNYERLKECLEKERSLGLVKSHLAKLKERLEDRRKDLDYVEKIMAKEYQDIVALEKLGMRKLFQEVLGSREEQLEIERQEYLMVVLKHREVVKSVALMEYEEQVLLEKVESLKEIKEEVKKLIAIREKELIAGGGAYRDEIKSINAKLDDKIAENREIYEAKIVCAKVKKQVALVIAYLNDAVAQDEWNDSYANRRKRTKSIDNAQGAFYKVKQFLEQLEDELYDIFQHRNIRFLNLVEDEEVLAKSYHSNLITDWVIHRKIHNSIFNMQFLHDRLERLSSSLEHEEKKVKESTSFLEKQREQWVLKGMLEK